MLQMSALEKAAIELLRLSLDIGSVRVVARSDANTINRCCDEFMPRLRTFLDDTRIPIIVRVTPNPVPLDNWMVGCLFFSVVDARALDTRFVIVVVGGDAALNRAAQRMEAVVPGCSLKLVTLEREPVPEQLTNLANSLRACFLDTVGHVGDEQLTW